MASPGFVKSRKASQGKRVSKNSHKSRGEEEKYSSFDVDCNCFCLASKHSLRNRLIAENRPTRFPDEVSDKRSSKLGTTEDKEKSRPVKTSKVDL